MISLNIDELTDSELTDSELRQLNREIVETLNRRTAITNMRAANSFKIGDLVKFTTKKWPFNVDGKITKINKTTAIVTPETGPA